MEKRPPRWRFRTCQTCHFLVESTDICQDRLGINVSAITPRRARRTPREARLCAVPAPGFFWWRLRPDRHGREAPTVGAGVGRGADPKAWLLGELFVEACARAAGVRTLRVVYNSAFVCDIICTFISDRNTIESVNLPRQARDEH
jgi:hypothetical protein